MRLLMVDKIKEDMVCAKTVFTSNGTILISEGTKLKNKYTDKLLNHGVYMIYVENELAKEIEIDHIIKEEIIQSANEIIKDTIDNISYYQDIDIIKIKDTINNIISQLFTNDNLILQVMEIRAVNDYILKHCVKVAVLSLMTGIALGYNKQQLMDLGTGAILHDIGKALIPSEVINKPSQLTIHEYEIVKEHTNLGYVALKSQGCVNEEVCNIILHHHERVDGKGYPNGLKGNEIHEYVRIVSIADVYDALTSDRIYRKRIDSSMAIEYIVSMSGTQFDQTLAKAFIQNIALYPIGKGVILNTKEKGFVIKNFKNFPTRPIVKIIYDENGQKLRKPYELNLIDYNTKSVIGTFS
ncbi:HD-GYP domain-containing protein [Clostridiaceae bacterium M8S5]|nr:HD-GYP domain-containing protein [Clostridiaceae bacterium M8S5]